MNEKQFDAFRERAIDELHEKQKLLSKYSRQGLIERWHFDQESATLQFFKSDGRLGVEADIIDIGSFSTRSSTWKWAWSNESVVPALRHRACALRELKDITGLALFTVEDERRRRRNRLGTGCIFDPASQSDGVLPHSSKRRRHALQFSGADDLPARPLGRHNKNYATIPATNCFTWRVSMRLVGPAIGQLSWSIRPAFRLTSQCMK